MLTQRIKHLLATRDIKQKDLAEAVGVVSNTVSYWVSGVRTPTTEQLPAIAKYFNVSIDYLFGLQKEPTTDKDLNFVCEYTGLNQKATMILRMISLLNESRIQLLNNIIESEYKTILEQMQYSTDENNNIVLNSSKEWLEFIYSKDIFSFFLELKEVIPKVSQIQTTSIISSLSNCLMQTSDNKEFVYIDSYDNIISKEELDYRDENEYKKIRKSELLNNYYKETFLKCLETFGKEYNKIIKRNEKEREELSEQTQSTSDSYDIFEILNKFQNEDDLKKYDNSDANNPKEE